MVRQLEKSKALLREVKQGRRSLNNHSSHEPIMHKRDGKESEHGNVESAWWVPHPRTGIYYPKGHEEVMEGIPKGAAAFQQSYWLRSSEGADKPTADPSTSDIFDHPFL